MEKLKNWLAENIAGLLVDILVLAAAVLVPVGVGMISIPAGLVAAGVCCFLLAVLLAKGAGGDRQ